jgi:hypothetical protein
MLGKNNSCQSFFQVVHVKFIIKLYYSLYYPLGITGIMITLVQSKVELKEDQAQCVVKTLGIVHILLQWNLILG